MASELFDAASRRLYLTREELVLAAAERAERRTRTFCLTLAYTGCRISEAPALTAGRVDLEGRTLGKAAKAMAGPVAR
jgi:integrase/recombinase XerD